MNLVIFGLAVSSAWGNGHATLWRGVLRSLAKMGHHAIFFERDTPYYAQHRDLPVGDGYEIALYPDWDAIAPRAEREIARADVAIVTSYCADAKAAARLVLGAKVRRVFYDLDTPVTLASLSRGEDVAYVPDDGLGGFDLVLSFTGGPALEHLRRRLGARRAAPLYGGVDVETHFPASSEAPSAGAARYACDLSYLGTYAADRQRSVETFFLDVARRSPERRFLLGGPMYPPTMQRPANVTWMAHVPPPEHPAFYASSGLTLNLTRAAMAEMGYCPSARLFEAAACGVPIVSDVWPGLDAFFEPGREILLATSTEDVERALATPRTELAALAARARARTLAEHTTEQRARELVALVESVSRASAPTTPTATRHDQAERT